MIRKQEVKTQAHGGPVGDAERTEQEGKKRGLATAGHTLHRTSHPGPAHCPSAAMCERAVPPSPCSTPSVCVPAWAPGLVDLATPGGCLLEPVRTTPGDSRTHTGHQTADRDDGPNPACKHRAHPTPLPAWPRLPFQRDVQTSQAASRPRTAALHKEDISQFMSILIYERMAREPGHQHKEGKCVPTPNPSDLAEK